LIKLTGTEIRMEIYSLVSDGGPFDEIVAILDKEPNAIETTDERGNTLLIRAALFGHNQIVKLLLKRGADPNRANTNKITPLMAAAMEHRIEIIDLLLRAKADKRPTSYEDKTAFDYAKEGDSTMRETIMEMLNTSNKKGCLPGSGCGIQGGVRESLAKKYCGCIKKVRRTVKAKTGKTPQNREGAAIAICTKTLLQSRGRTLRKFTCKKGKANLKTQPLLK
jgi:ankyrin repeat protein